MSLFEKNLRALAARDKKSAERIEAATASETISVEQSRSGHPVPKVGGVALHSAYHPEKEGGRFAEGRLPGSGGTAVVFGFGFGYHLERLAAEAENVIVIEPSGATLRAAFETRDLSDIIEKVDITTPDEFREREQDIDHEKSVWLDHEPTARLYRKERDLLAEPFIIRSIAAARRYKVLVVGPVYGGSVPTAASAARALKSLRFDVELMDNTGHKNELFYADTITRDPDKRAVLKNLYNNYLGETIAAKADDVRPDIILALAQAPIPPAVIERLKALGAPIIFWFVENHRAIPYWKMVAPHYDYFFGIQKGEFLDMLAEAGASYAGYLPQAADPEVHHPASLTAGEKEKYGAPISFMGAGYYNRRVFFTGLLDLPFKVWGTEWDLTTPLGKLVQNKNRRLAPEEYVKIFLSGTINLNLHSSTTSPGIDPINDFVNPRTFEIAACGAFQLVDNRRELPEMFRIGEEIVTFDSMEDLREKIDYYLKHPEEREAIAMAGMRRVLREHTFVHRMARMMSVVIPREEKKIENARERLRGINDVDRMIARANDAELAEFLSKFKGQGNLSLRKVMDAIAEGEGPLSRPEAIFVMVNEVLSQGV